MAKQLNVNLAFTADTSQAKAQLQQLQNQLNSLVKGQGISDSHLGITQEIREGINAAAQLKVQLEAATNINTGKLDLNKFSRSLRQSGMDLKTYAKQLEQLGPAGTDAFLSLSRAISNAEAPLVRINKHVAQLGTTLVNTIRWQFSSSLIHSLQSGVQTIIRYTEDLNESLNNIRIVTGQSTEQMAKFAKEANKAAKALSTTTVEYTDAALIFYQQGLSDEEVKKRTDITVKMANVAGESVETVSDQLTAVWNNFYDGTKALEYYADVMTALGAATASSVDEISGGLDKFAAIGNTIGLSFEYAAAALATITSNTRQSEEVVGTALKTIFARVQGLNLGETQEDGTTLNKYSEALNKVGISIFEANGQLKDMDSILNELAGKWDTLNNAEQTALAQTVAGVRQYTQLIALMENWDNGDSDSMMANLDTSYGATGALQEQADIYAESWEAAADRVKASAESIYDALLNDEAIIDLMDGFSGFLDLINTFIDALGGVPGLLALVSTAALKLASPQISNGIYNLVEGTKEFFNINGARDAANKNRTEAWDIAKRMRTDEFSRAGLASITHIEQEAKIQETLLKNANKLSEEQRRKYEYQLDGLRVLQQEHLKEINNLETLEQQIELLREKRALSSTDYTTRQNNAYNQYLNFNEQYGANKFLNEQLNQSTIQLQRKSGGTPSLLTVGDYKNLLTSLQIPEGSRLNEQRDTLLKLLNTGRDNLNIKTFINRDGTKNNKGEQVLTFGKGHETIIKSINKLIEDIQHGLEKAIKGTGASAKQGLSDSEQKDIDNAGEGSRNKGYQQKKTDANSKGVQQQSDAINKSILKDIEAAEKWSDTLVKVAGNISYFTMGLTSLTNAFNTMAEGIKEGTFELKDLTSVLMSLGMAVPMLLNSITALTDGTVLGTLTSKLFTTAKQKETLAELEGAAAKEYAAKIQKTANVYIMLAVVAITLLITILKAVIKTRKEAQKSIQDSINKYKEEKDKLDELNNSLEETKNRIKELSEQDTLTLVEQEELEKLKLQNRYLEQQIQLQEKITKEANESKVKNTLKDFSKAYKDLIPAFNYNPIESTEPININYGGGWNDNTIYKSSEIDRPSIDSERLKQYQEAENSYFEVVSSIVFDGASYNVDQLKEAQRILEENRKNLYTDAEYKTTFIDPILNTALGDYSGDAIFNALANEDETTARSIISKQLENELMLAGISVDEFIAYVSSQTSGVIDKITEATGASETAIKERTKDFTQEDWEILASLNFENIETADELWAAFEKYKETAINVEVVGIDTLNEVLNKLNESQKPLETALSSYSDKGYLTMDEVQELINENPEYSKYIIYDEIADRYKLIGQALTDFKDLEAKEKEALNELLELNNEQNQVNKDYLNEYVGLLNALQESSDFQYLNNNYQELKTAAENYQQGNLSTSQYLEDVGKNIDTIIDQYSQLTEDMANGDETADELEAALTSVTGMLSNGLMDLNKQFQSGSITMQEYYKGTISGTKSLINSYQGLYKNTIQLKNGTWQLKEGIEATEESASAINKLNLWQEQINSAEGMSSVVETLTKNYDYLVQYAGAFGQIDFTINDNFDTTAQHFQTMCDSMGHTLESLAKTNADAYSNIIKTVQAQGFKFDAGLTTSAKALSDQMNENADLASAVVNACMEETGGVITSVSQAAGTILAELGELITNFDYNISFTVDNAENLDKNWFFKFLRDPTTELPTISITGNGGDNVQGFTQALSSAANFLSSQGTGMGQGGIFDYGYEDIDNSALDPNAIITDNLNSSGDDAFDRLQKKLEFKLKIDTDELKKLDYLLNKYSDEFYLLSESAETLLSTIDHRTNILNIHEDHIADLTAAYNAGQISAEDYNSAIESSKDAIYEQLNALLDLDKQMKEYYENTLNEADTELEDHTDHIQHLSKVFDYYVNLMDIFGKSKDYDAMGNFLQGQADIIKHDLDIAEEYYNILANERDVVKGLLDEAIASGDEARIEQLERDYDAIVDSLDKAEDAMLEKTEQWAEAMKKVFENTFNKLSDELEKALTDGMGFDSLLDDFDLLNQQQEEFLTKTNQIYETNKLMRIATKAMDDTSNKAAKQKIKNYIEETKKLQNTTRLSKYELEIQQAKYDLLLAEIALEEAQNAKSTVRLTRDNEGNFGYIYTADQDEVDDAQQQLEDAQNNLYNIQYEGQQNALTKYVEAEEAYFQAVIDIQQKRLDGEFSSEEDYRKELARLEEAYYGPTGILTELSRLYNITLQENTNATAENMLNKYGFMTDGVEQHATLVQQFIGDMDVAWNEFQGALTQIHDDIQNALNNSEQATKDLKDESEALAEKIKKDVLPAIEQEIIDVREATSAYALQRGEILRLIDQYEDYINTLKAVAAAEASVGGSGSNDGGFTQPPPNGDTEEDDKKGNYPTCIYCGGLHSPADCPHREKYKVVELNGGYGLVKTVKGLRQGETISVNGTNYFKPSGLNFYVNPSSLEPDPSGQYWIIHKGTPYYQITALDTGGYTGDWGPEGKLAMLHEKELVLNAADTSNILSAVSIIREIARDIDARASMSNLSLLTSAIGVNDTNQVLEQMVSIEASFPNATDRYEIEEAFNSLVNKAAQYANRK